MAGQLIGHWKGDFKLADINVLQELQNQYQASKATQQSLSQRLAEFDKYKAKTEPVAISATTDMSGVPAGYYNPMNELGNLISSLQAGARQRQGFQSGLETEQGNARDLLKQISDLQNTNTVADQLKNLQLKDEMAKLGYDVNGNPIDKASAVKANLGASKYQQGVNDLYNAEGIIDEVIKQSKGIPAGRVGGPVATWLNQFIKIGNYKNYNDFKQANLGKIARAISGEVGVLNEADIKRAEGLFPSPNDTQAEADNKLTLIKALLDDRRDVLGLPALPNNQKSGTSGGTTQQNTVEDYINNATY